MICLQAQYGDRPEIYNRYIMQEFRSKSLDMPGVLREVSLLFPDEPDMFEGFKPLLHGSNTHAGSESSKLISDQSTPSINKDIEPSTISDTLSRTKDNSTQDLSRDGLVSSDDAATGASGVHDIPSVKKERKGGKFEEPQSAKTGSGSGSSGRYIWFCGWCNRGPMTVGVDEHCHYCSRPRDQHSTYEVEDF